MLYTDYKIMLALLALNHLEQCLRCSRSIILSSPSNTLALCISSTVRLVLNTTSLLWDLILQIFILLFMSNHHIKKSVSFTIYCYYLASDLVQVTKTMWLCKKCVSWSLSCHVDLKSFKCSECVSHISYKCDLIISKTEWAWV